MRRIIYTLTTLALSFAVQTTAFASPKQLITHNLTDYESNAFVAGTVPSQYPTKAHSSGKVFWAAVRMACTGHIIDSKCSALVRVGTNTENPIDVGTLELNIETGEITPSVVHGNGYTITVNGIAETTLSKD